MASRILALLIWAAVAASLAYWGLRWLAQPTAVPANATAVSLDSAARGDLRKLLTGPVVVDAAQPDPRAVRAGGTVDGDMVLLAVSQRGAEIGPAAGPAAVKLDLPLLPGAATGSLPPPTGFSTGEANPPPQQMPGAVPDINSGMAGTPEGMPQGMPGQFNGNPPPVRPGGNRAL